MIDKLFLQKVFYNQDLNLVWNSKTWFNLSPYAFSDKTRCAIHNIIPVTVTMKTNLN